MKVLDLLNSKNSIVFNKCVAKIFGIDSTILLGFLCSCQQGEAETFHIGIDAIVEETCLTEYRVRNAMEDLVDKGVLQIARQGLPAKNFYSINEQTLIELLNVKISRSCKFDTSCLVNKEEQEKTKKSNTKENNKEKEENKEKQINLLKEITIVEVDTNEHTSNAEIVKRFKKPTPEQIQEYCNERQNGLSGQSIFDHYEAKGWKIGKTPMKDWKAAVRTWERNTSKTRKDIKTNVDTPLKRSTLSINDVLSIREQYKQSEDDYE